LDIQLYLRIAPELYLKRLIVGGLAERVYEIGRNFRNEGLSVKHDAQFTMLECYQAFTDYEGMIELVEAIFEAAAKAAVGSTKVKHGDVELNFTAPLPRASMCDLVHKATGVDFLKLDVAEARTAARKAGAPITGKENWGQAVEAVFGHLVEPTLIQPIHVTDLPRDISPLAKVHRMNDKLTERFETYCEGAEMANAFSELSDPQAQLAAFMDQLKQREGGNDEAMHLDRDYVNALEHGLPPTGGLGVGIDRLVMKMTGIETIRDVILFPTLKPRNE
jgi:lysyl-tRNA synthetase class 2